jgi:Predicted AAA-ATPase/PD-(D/E)XK nuclease superfamily
MFKKLPIGIQDFEKLRKNEFLYVDKTQYAHQLYSGAGYYFLSRPRRFGKSLMISTLKSIFSGQKELFKGLWIEHKIEWKQFPIIHIPFNEIGVNELGLTVALDLEFDRIATQNNIPIIKATFSQKFKYLITELGKNTEGVVILIDEYDKPIVDYIDNLDKSLENQNILKDLYSVVKSSDKYIRFALFTGVSKFSKVSIFSDLNNLDDITFSPKYNAICGYTHQELLENFDDYIHDLSDKNSLSKTETLEQIRLWYNGYSWNGEERVYNPFGTLKLFENQVFLNVWFTTGTPTFLMKFLKDKQLYDVENTIVSENLFETYTLENLNIIALLFQTGYLTIKEKIGPPPYEYVLSYPNLEVKQAFLENLLMGYTHEKPYSRQFINALKNNDLTAFFKAFNILFSEIPEPIFLEKYEAYYHAIIHITLTLIGCQIQSEVVTSGGRLDSTIQTADTIYIFEFKINRTANYAMSQIKKKQYADKYRSSEKKIIGVAVSLGTKLKGIKEWKQEDLT